MDRAYHKFLKLCTSEILLQVGFPRTTGMALTAATDAMLFLIEQIVSSIETLDGDICIEHLYDRYGDNEILEFVKLQQDNTQDILTDLKILPRNYDWSTKDSGLQTTSNSRGIESNANFIDEDTLCLIDEMIDYKISEVAQALTTTEILEIGAVVAPMALPFFKDARECEYLKDFTVIYNFLIENQNNEQNTGNLINIADQTEILWKQNSSFLNSFNKTNDHFSCKNTDIFRHDSEFNNSSFAIVKNDLNYDTSRFNKLQDEKTQNTPPLSNQKDYEHDNLKKNQENPFFNILVDQEIHHWDIDTQGANTDNHNVCDVYQSENCDINTQGANTDNHNVCDVYQSENCDINTQGANTDNHNVCDVSRFQNVIMENHINHFDNKILHDSISSIKYLDSITENNHNPRKNAFLDSLGCFSSAKDFKCTTSANFIIPSNLYKNPSQTPFNVPIFDETNYSQVLFNFTKRYLKFIDYNIFVNFFHYFHHFQKTISDFDESTNLMKQLEMNNFALMSFHFKDLIFKPSNLSFTQLLYLQIQSCMFKEYMNLALNQKSFSLENNQVKNIHQIGFFDSKNVQIDQRNSPTVLINDESIYDQFKNHSNIISIQNRKNENESINCINGSYESKTAILSFNHDINSRVKIENTYHNTLSVSNEIIENKIQEIDDSELNLDLVTAYKTTFHQEKNPRISSQHFKDPITTPTFDNSKNNYSDHRKGVFVSDSNENQQSHTFLKSNADNQKYSSLFQNSQKRGEESAIHKISSKKRKTKQDISQFSEDKNLKPLNHTNFCEILNEIQPDDPLPFNEINTLQGILKHMHELEKIDALEDLTKNDSNLYDPLITLIENREGYDEIDLKDYFDILQSQEHNKFTVTAYMGRFENILENYSVIQYNEPEIED